jgi:hypothetical protein
MKNKIKRLAPSQKIRLPKQWLHWAKLAGLKPESSDKNYRHGRNPYLRGRNRNWRVTNQGYFECSCPLQRFDKWANSVGSQCHSLPETKQQFLILIASLIAESEGAR